MKVCPKEGIVIKPEELAACMMWEYKKENRQAIAGVCDAVFRAADLLTKGGNVQLTFDSPEQIRALQCIIAYAAQGQGHIKEVSNEVKQIFNYPVPPPKIVNLGTFKLPMPKSPPDHSSGD